MTRSPKFHIVRITAAIVSIQIIVFVFLGIRKQAEARRIEALALEILHDIQSGSVTEVFFYDRNYEKSADELNPTKIAGWENRIDQLQWLGEDAFNEISFYPYEVGMLNLQITPEKNIRIVLWESGDTAWKEQPSPEKFKGVYVVYTSDRAFIMR